MLWVGNNVSTFILCGITLYCNNEWSFSPCILASANLPLVLALHWNIVSPGQWYAQRWPTMERFPPAHAQHLPLSVTCRSVLNGLLTCALWDMRTLIAVRCGPRRVQGEEAPCRHGRRVAIYLHGITKCWWVQYPWFWSLQVGLSHWIKIYGRVLILHWSWLDYWDWACLFLGLL